MKFTPSTAGASSKPTLEPSHGSFVAALRACVCPMVREMEGYFCIVHGRAYRLLGTTCVVIHALDYYAFFPAVFPLLSPEFLFSHRDVKVLCQFAPMRNECQMSGHIRLLRSGFSPTIQWLSPNSLFDLALAYPPSHMHIPRFSSSSFLPPPIS